MTSTDVIVEDRGPVTAITLNRPERRNALSLALMEELTGAIAAASGRVIVIAGAGPGFSAGHDLAEMIGRDAGFYDDLFGACTRLMDAAHDVPQPVIAKVHGVATAAGCQLVAACDLAVAGESARFATPGVKIGLFCSTPMVPLSRAIGRKRALGMLLTGALVDSRTAEAWGLVNEVVADDELDGAVDRLAARLAEASPLTLRVGKEAFYRQVDLGERAAYDLTREVMSRNALLHDAQEGMTSFLEKRRPEWTGT